MQAVILAAGLGTRMRPLTNTVAKPMLSLAGRPLVEYAFDALPEAVDEVIMVIGYLGEQIVTHLGTSFRGRKIRYVTQKNLEGTAKALFEAQALIVGRFLVLMADDIYAKKDIEKCLASKRAILVMRSRLSGPGGLVVLNERGVLKEVIEGKEHPADSLVSIGAYLLTPEIFNYEPVKLTDREGEWGLPQTVVRMAQDFPVAVVEATRWIKITTPDDIILAETLLKSPASATLHAK